jgi:hypothetical protein
VKRVIGIAVVALAVIAATLGMATPASADTIVVRPGESIQAAINRASPGDTIVVRAGVYREGVRVTKNNLTLRGVGGSPEGTVLRPPAEGGRCLRGAAGICVFGERTAQGMKPRVGTVIEGFRFENFEAFGVIGFGTRNTLFARNVADGNGEYGLACFTCHDIDMIGNKAFENDVAGIYVGDSANAEANLLRNVVADNGEFGFFLRDARVGRVEDNQAFRNCSGIGLVNTGAPIGAKGWLVLNNRVHHNNEVCEGGGGSPPISGIGIWLLGGRNNDIAHNRLWENTGGGPSIASGGIVLQNSAPLGGAPAAHNEVRSNQAFRNAPDIFWDGDGAGNEFRKNQCTTSEPPGLCDAD